MEIQIGKKGLTAEFMEELRKRFKNHSFVDVRLLKAYSRNREEAEEAAKQICLALQSEKEKFFYRRIGFKIVIIKRKSKKIKTGKNSR